MALTYSGYLEVKKLTSLQNLQSSPPEHDELLFIIIHQVYELWFKQLLHECDAMKAAFRLGHEPQIMAGFKRVLAILKTVVAQVDVIETMTPLSFASFRSRLDTASGFQSVQFRELEFMLGAKEPRFLKFHENDDWALSRITKRLKEPSLYDDFLAFLKLKGFAIPNELLNRDYSLKNPESEDVRKILVGIYKSDPMLSQLCERLVDLDEGLQEWRYRHVKMVERTIGTKPGTGGSSGAQYLKATLFQPFFADLWTIRSEF